MTVTLNKAVLTSDAILDIVAIARTLIAGRIGRCNAVGVMADPARYLAALQAARDTLDRAIALHEAAEWPDSTDYSRLCAAAAEGSESLPARPNAATIPPALRAGETPWTVTFTREEFRLCWLEAFDAVTYAVRVRGIDWLMAWQDGDAAARAELDAWRQEGEPF